MEQSDLEDVIGMAVSIESQPATGKLVDIKGCSKRDQRILLLSPLWVVDQSLIAVPS